MPRNNVMTTRRKAYEKDEKTLSLGFAWHVK